MQTFETITTPRGTVRRPDKVTRQRLEHFHTTVMACPHEYEIFDTITGKWSECLCAPRQHELMTYQPEDETKTRTLTQTRVAYIDTRYAAKMRLYNYLLEKHNLGDPFRGKSIYEGTEIGRTLPILNF